jgi:hypothetical protein
VGPGTEALMVLLGPGDGQLTEELPVASWRHDGRAQEAASRWP